MIRTFYFGLLLATPLAAIAEPAQAQGLSDFTDAFSSLLSFQDTVITKVGEIILAIQDGASLAALWTGIVFAFFYGAIGSAGPIHSTLMMTSYFLGREASLWRGIVMGAQIAVVHVAAAAAIVWLVDLKFRQFLLGAPDVILWIKGASYLLISLAGLYFLLRHRARRKGDPDEEFHPVASWAQQALLALAGGIVPSTGGILIMLFAISNDVTETGLWLAGALAAGMALTMAVIGVVSILLRRIVIAVAVTQERGNSVMLPLLEYLSPILIILVGAGFLIPLLLKLLL